MNTPTTNINNILKRKGFNSKTDICHLSFEELRRKMKDELSWSQTQSLYLEAQQEQKKNLLHEASILKRANPHLQSAVHLALTTPHADQQGYNSRFGNRASKYAAPGAISSMFSPAAYLAELYRQAQNLHAEGSIYHLDTRRPDLKSLALSQKNMDTEISTLSLSNNMLLEGIKTQPNLGSHTKVMEKLSTIRTSGTLPYHDAYESVRKIIQLQAPVFEHVITSPETTIDELKYQASLLEINASVSPDLFNILTSMATEDNVQNLYLLSFGDIKPSLMIRPEQLKNYYHLTDQEAGQFIKKEEITRVHELIESEESENPAKYYLLRLNKFIRLSRITKLPLTIIQSIILSSTDKYSPEKYKDDEIYDIIEVPALPQYNEFRDKPDINTEVLKKAFRVKYYMQRYGIDAKTTLRLCKISTLEDDNTTHPSPPDLAKLLADIHQLTINELDLLLVAIGKERITDLPKINETDLITLIDKLYAITNWLCTRKLSVYQLFAMTTTDYNKTLVPEIHNLLDTVYNDLQDFDKKKVNTKEELLKAISPYIAPALQLPSEHAAYSILTWADKLEPGTEKMTAEKLWNWLRKNPVTAQPEFQKQAEPVVQYCQCLAQLALIYRSIGLSESTLRLFVTKPQLFIFKDKATETTGTIPAHDVSTLMTLMRFADWINSLGENASSVLTGFEKGTLTVELLAKAMNLDENLLSQAKTQALTNFSNWPSIDIIRQCISISHQLNISPQGVSTLAKTLTAKSPSDNYTQWENVAAILTAAGHPKS